jgi:hypothetical protein
MSIKNEIKPKALISINPQSDSFEVEDCFSEEDVCRWFGVDPKLLNVGVDIAKKEDNTVSIQVIREGYAKAILGDNDNKAIESGKKLTVIK